MLVPISPFLYTKPSIALIYFPVSAIKFCGEGNMKKKKVILSHHLKALSTLIEQTRMQKLETSGVFVSTTRKQREINLCYCSVPFSMYTLCHPSCRDTHISYHNWNSSPKRSPEAHCLGDSAICQLTMNTNPHM